MLLLPGLAHAGEKVVIGGVNGWTAVMLVGHNPYGNKKSFYATPIKYRDWGVLNLSRLRSPNATFF